MKLCELVQDDRDAINLDIKHNKGRRLKDIVRARSKKNNGADDKTPSAEMVDVSFDADNNGAELDASNIAGIA